MAAAKKKKKKVARRAPAKPKSELERFIEALLKKNETYEVLCDDIVNALRHALEIATGRKPEGITPGSRVMIDGAQYIFYIDAEGRKSLMRNGKDTGDGPTDVENMLERATAVD